MAYNDVDYVGGEDTGGMDPEEYLALADMMGVGAAARAELSASASFGNSKKKKRYSGQMVPARPLSLTDRLLALGASKPSPTNQAPLSSLVPRRTPPMANNFQIVPRQYQTAPKAPPPAVLQKLMKLRQRATAGKLPAIFLGFSQSVAGSTSGQVASSTPNVKLRPTDLLVRDSNAALFVATSIRIGRIDLVAGSTQIPMDAFISTVQRPPISSPELDGGTPATITLTNLGGGTQTFRAMYTALDLSNRPAC